MDGKHGWYSGSRWRPPAAINDVQQLKNSFGACTAPWSDLWTGGLVCAFEFVRRRGHGFASPPIDLSRSNSSQSKDLPIITDSGSSTDGDEPRMRPACRHGRPLPAESYWCPIGWTRITELAAMVDGDDERQGIGLTDAGHHHCCGDRDDDDITVADVAVPYWQRPAGPTWWCHVAAGHPAVDAWLATSARWLHPAICVALRDETMLISDKMKHLLYEVPVRVSGGLLFGSAIRLVTKTTFLLSSVLGRLKIS